MWHESALTGLASCDESTYMFQEDVRFFVFLRVNGGLKQWEEDVL